MSIHFFCNMRYCNGNGNAQLVKREKPEWASLPIIVLRYLQYVSLMAIILFLIDSEMFTSCT